MVSAYKTKKVTSREQLASISWVRQTWLGIEEKDPVARLAWRWRIYLDRSQLVDGVYYVRYEDFCANKVGFIANLASRVGIDIDVQDVRARCELQASSPEARDYRPKGPGAWKREPCLSCQDREIIEEICGEYMQTWGYL